MAGIVQNGQKRLNFSVVPQVRTKMREKGKREKQQQQQHENKQVKGKYTNIYAYVYIHTFTDIQTYTNTDTHIHINTLCVIQVRLCFLTICLKVFKLLALLVGTGKLFQIEGPI